MDIANYLMGSFIPKEYTAQMRKRLIAESRHFIWDAPYLFRRSVDGVLRRCVDLSEVTSILEHCHEFAYGGHFGADKTVKKVWQSGFYWPTMYRDA